MGGVVLAKSGASTPATRAPGAQGVDSHPVQAYEASAQLRGQGYEKTLFGAEYSVEDRGVR